MAHTVSTNTCHTLAVGFFKGLLALAHRSWTEGVCEHQLLVWIDSASGAYCVLHTAVRTHWLASLKAGSDKLMVSGDSSGVTASALRQQGSVVCQHYYDDDARSCNAISECTLWKGTVHMWWNHFLLALVFTIMTWEKDSRTRKQTTHTSHITTQSAICSSAVAGIRKSRAVNSSRSALRLKSTD